MHDIETVQQLDAWVADLQRQPSNFIALDLRTSTSAFATLDLAGSAFLGCAMEPALLTQSFSQGAIVFGEQANLPFRLFRANLYAVTDIYAGFDPGTPGSWNRSFDYLAYQWFMDPATQRPRPIGLASTVAARVHDTSMERAVAKFLAAFAGPTVGFMGGHDRLRDDPAYERVVGLARSLRRAGCMIVSGGGPGFMEAANLGAFLAPFGDAELGAAMSVLKTVPRYTDTHGWLSTACKVRSDLLGDWQRPSGKDSSNLGIPTWLYGHEPPNLFCSDIGKFFYNSLREDGLVTIADGGIVFAEGNAGTVQEIFQDATQNYYRPAGVAPTPMVLFNSTAGFWDLPCDEVVDPKRKKPVRPLLKQLANERASTAFDSAILVTDDPDEIVNFLSRSMMKSVPAGELTRGAIWQAHFP